MDRRLVDKDKEVARRLAEKDQEMDRRLAEKDQEMGRRLADRDKEMTRRIADKEKEMVRYSADKDELLRSKDHYLKDLKEQTVKSNERIKHLEQEASDKLSALLEMKTTNGPPIGKWGEHGSLFG